METLTDIPTIKPTNQQAHVDIEKDINRQKDGVFTFYIKVDNGNIVDYVYLENTTCTIG